MRTIEARGGTSATAAGEGEEEEEGGEEGEGEEEGEGQPGVT